MRAVAVFATASLAFASAAGAEGGASPTDLDWLRGEVGDGALVHQADGRIYLTELSNPDTVHVGNGGQPEFSPDGSKFAWIDGRAAKGRLRKGDTTTHVIAKGVAREGGVHWLSNNEVALVLWTEDGKDKDGKDKWKRRWFRVSLDGAREGIPELTALGPGGPEIDVRLGDDGVWSYVEDETWRTSDGNRGRVKGTCSVSISPDGRSVISLYRGHKVAPIQPIRPGGVDRELRWAYGGGFDNHRFASSDPRFVVAVDEIDQESRNVTYPVVIALDGSGSTRMATRGFARHGVYGDFVVGSGEGAPWPKRNP